MRRTWIAVYKSHMPVHDQIAGKTRFNYQPANSSMPSTECLSSSDIHPMHSGVSVTIILIWCGTWCRTLQWKHCDIACSHTRASPPRPSVHWIQWCADTSAWCHTSYRQFSLHWLVFSCLTWKRCELPWIRRSHLVETGLLHQSCCKVLSIVWTPLPTLPSIPPCHWTQLVSQSWDTCLQIDRSTELLAQYAIWWAMHDELHLTQDSCAGIPCNVWVWWHKLIGSLWGCLAFVSGCKQSLSSYSFY